MKAFVFTFFVWFALFLKLASFSLRVPQVEKQILCTCSLFCIEQFIHIISMHLAESCTIVHNMLLAIRKMNQCTWKKHINPAIRNITESFAVVISFIAKSKKNKSHKRLTSFDVYQPILALRSKDISYTHTDMHLQSDFNFISYHTKLYVFEYISLISICLNSICHRKASVKLLSFPWSFPIRETATNKIDIDKFIK